MTKQIPLTQGKVTIIDDEDFARFGSVKWRVMTIRGKWYALRTAGMRPFRHTELLHRAILNAAKDIDVDHINGDTLDNRRANLRLATNAENLRNRGKNKNNTSGYKGVTWDKYRQKWQARIKVNGKLLDLGRFETAEDAARTYDESARELHGEFAQTNF